ncbi:hypothetical protein M513_03757 [Trichuris suis]|uniref:Uncharacterized protein n=1 Tax=Trichuris suis TaxID=68888 RepID=A0A085MDX1_9BILA|nr:hypothetical protein M513_03757 [Trichuris suis]
MLIGQNPDSRNPGWVKFLIGQKAAIVFLMKRTLKASLDLVSVLTHAIAVSKLHLAKEDFDRNIEKADGIAKSNRLSEASDQICDRSW